LPSILAILGRAGLRVLNIGDGSQCET